jgi:predicted transcriptional regulator
MQNVSDNETDRLIRVLRHRDALAELRQEVVERRELEDRLGVSRATTHRYVRTLEQMRLAEKTNNGYVLTELGEDIATAVATFENEVHTRIRLAPLVDVMRNVTPPMHLDAFTDASVESVTDGDPFGPLSRFVSLMEETETLRGINTCRISPPYIEEFQRQVLDGMETELIEHPRIYEDIMENYPEKCVEVCASGYLTLWLREPREVLPFGLVLFDNRVGVGLFNTENEMLDMFVDTDTDEAVEWATEVYEQYKSNAVHLDNFTKKGLYEALEEC